ncbi:hypothetical protein ACF0H5_015892 [Mactra antiquata]
MKHLVLCILIIKCSKVWSAEKTSECSELKEEVKALQKGLKIMEEILHSSLDIQTKEVYKESESKRFVVDGEVDLEQEVIRLSQEISSLKQGFASTYVRWGKNDCPANISLVYKGYMGGNTYTDNGGPANYVCLPDDPTWSKYEDGIQTFANGLAEGNGMYGTEYELFGTFNPFNKAVHDEDAPCAVCRTNHISTIMIPARNNCYPGWQLQYSGYLMTIHSTHPAATEYVCVDGNPDFIPHGSANTNGNVLYFVEAVCGSLPCLPYVQGRELACVVCSK